MRVILVLTLWMFTTVHAHSQQAELSVTPKKCVAFKKGQICYQTIRIKFKALVKSDFCLTVDDQPEPLQCWKDSDIASFSYRLASTSGVEFKMVDTNKQTLATARISVAWVYKESRTKNRWRLF